MLHENQSWGGTKGMSIYTLGISLAGPFVAWFIAPAGDRSILKCTRIQQSSERSRQERGYLLNFHDHLTSVRIIDGKLLGEDSLSAAKWKWSFARASPWDLPSPSKTLVR